METDEQTTSDVTTTESTATTTAPADNGTATTTTDETTTSSESTTEDASTGAEDGETDDAAEDTGDGDDTTDDNSDDQTTETSDGDDTPDLKSMSRAERAQYFQKLEADARKQAEATVNDTYQPQSVDDLKQKYLDQGHSEFEAKMLARDEMREQEADIARARAERAELNANLATEAMEVMSTIEWLNPKNADAYDEAASDAAVELYDALCLLRDENTADKDADGNVIPGTSQIISAVMTPKKFYGLMDTIRSSGVETAKTQAQKAAEEQMAAVAAPSSNSTKKERDFDLLSNDEKREYLRKQGHIVT